MTKEELITEAVDILSKEVIKEIDILTLISRFRQEIRLHNPSTIMFLAGKQFGVSAGEMISKSQERPCVYARGFYTKYMRKFNKSYASLGQIFGGRCHATMMSCLRTVDNIINHESDFALKWVAFEEDVKKL
jgi:chromosomal replication initiation ATPase DnaA